MQGYDFFKNSRKITDTQGHGTHVTSLITLDNPVKFKIIPLRFTDGSDGTNVLKDMQNFNKALEMAIDLDVDIINISYTHKLFRHSELELLKKAQAKGILVITAAGNEGKNQDEIADINLKSYPCNYELDNVICVGNWDSQENKIDTSSNFGGRVLNFVDGNSKVGLGKSTDLHDKLEIMSGSSQAAALMTKWVIQEKNKGIKNKEILEKLQKQKTILVSK